jgi:hypothetical protein
MQSVSMGVLVGSRRMSVAQTEELLSEVIPNENTPLDAGFTSSLRTRTKNTCDNIHWIRIENTFFKFFFLNMV